MPFELPIRVASGDCPEHHQGVPGLPSVGVVVVAATSSTPTPILPGCTWNVSVCPARSTTSVRGPLPGASTATTNSPAAFIGIWSYMVMTSPTCKPRRCAWLFSKTLFTTNSPTWLDGLPIRICIRKRAHSSPLVEGCGERRIPGGVCDRRAVNVEADRLDQTITLVVLLSSIVRCHSRPLGRRAVGEPCSSK